ncbi:hypothetical protein XHC_4060 [Xanthomonas hortorum pv. carotae str. M081]|nr:hypothetical protein XHC_4060 [Xanthomonas hortorum pv. carotae str. M081]
MDAEHGDSGSHDGGAAWSSTTSAASRRCHGVQVTAVTGGRRRRGRMLRSTLQ